MSYYTKRKQMLLRIITFCLLILLLPAGGLMALDVRDGEFIQVQTGETVKGPGFYSGRQVQIDGTVDGTTFAFGGDVRINGIIEGDLIVAGQNVQISGEVLGNLYAAAQYLTISGQVAGDVFGAAQNIVVTGDAVLQRDLLLAGQLFDYSGQVARQLLAAAQDIKINGSIKDDVKVAVEDLTIDNQAVVGGDIFYQSSNQALVASGAEISGKTEWKKTESKEMVDSTEKNYKSIFLRFLWGLASALLIWFLVAVWRPQLWQGIQQQITAHPLKTIGVGVLGFIVIPIFAILMMITVIGLPLGIILLLAYGILIYLTKIIVAVYIANWLAKRFVWPQKHRGLWLVLLGLAIIGLLTKIPILGMLINLLVVFAGLGSVILMALKPDISKEKI